MGTGTGSISNILGQATGRDAVREREEQGRTLIPSQCVQILMSPRMRSDLVSPVIRTLDIPRELIVIDAGP